MPRIATGKSPLDLSNRMEDVALVEIGELSWRVKHYNLNSNKQGLTMNLDFVEEARERATVRPAMCKARIAKAYNARVRPKNFQVWNLVMRKVETSSPVGKLDPKLEGHYKSNLCGTFVTCDQVMKLNFLSLVEISLIRRGPFEVTKSCPEPLSQTLRGLQPNLYITVAITKPDHGGPHRLSRDDDGRHDAYDEGDEGQLLNCGTIIADHFHYHPSIASDRIPDAERR
ncbi:UNVERIFIED_CONTAM: hypothetical protein Sindi_2279100 [Sesamum indicum]